MKELEELLKKFKGTEEERIKFINDYYKKNLSNVIDFRSRLNNIKSLMDKGSGSSSMFLDPKSNRKKTFDKGKPLKTANTVNNMIGNVSSYFFGNKDKNLLKSPYKPTKSKDEEAVYYTRKGMKEDVYKDFVSPEVMENYNHDGTFEDVHKALINKGEDRQNNASESFPKNQAGYNGMYNRGHGSLVGEFNLGRYRTDAGEDENGKYVSFSDTYDWNGMMDEENSINYYDRIYEKEWKDFDKAKGVERGKKEKEQVKTDKDLNLANTTKKIPKAIWGALIGAGTSMISNVISSAQENRAIEEANERNKKIFTAQKYRQDSTTAQNFDTSGKAIVEYAQGGGINPNGGLMPENGALVQQSSDMEKVVGPKHEQDGVVVSQNGNPVAEVEGDEMIKDGQKVFSDRLSPDGKETFAQLADKISKKKGKLEIELSKGEFNEIKKNTLERNIDKLGIEEDQLFQQQEDMKKQQGIKQEYAKVGAGVRAFGGILTDPTDPTDPNKKGKLSEKQRKEVNAAVGLEFDNKTASRLFGLSDADETVNSQADLDYGQYKGRKFFNVKKQGSNYVVNPSSSNPQNAQGFKEQMNTLRKLNPNAVFSNDGYLQFKDRLAYGGKIPKAAMGVGIPDERGETVEPKYADSFAEKVVPYVDNVANIFTTLSKAKVPDPVFAPAPSINTKVNVSDQLNNVNNAVNRASSNIEENTSNSRTGRAQRAQTELAGSAQKNQILARKDNLEAGKENQAAQIQGQYASQNAQIANNNLNQNMMRALAVNQEISDNVANAVDDAGYAIDNKRRERLADKKTDLYREIYSQGDSSLAARTMMDDPVQINSWRTNPEEFDAWATELLNDPSIDASTKRQIRTLKRTGLKSN